MQTVGSDVTTGEFEQRVQAAKWLFKSCLDEISVVHLVVLGIRVFVLKGLG